MKYKALFLLFLSLSALAGFKVFGSFNAIVQNNQVSTPFMILNTILLSLIWFLSYSSDREFVRKHLNITVGAPAVLFTVGNFLTVLLSADLAFAEFVPFMIYSTSLIVFSYLAARTQLKLESVKQEPITL